MLLAVELLFLGAGIFAVIAGRLPEWFVGKGYYAEGPLVRVLGGAMILPLPIAFCAGFMLALIDTNLASMATIIEIVLILGVAIGVVITLRKIRKPVASLQTTSPSSQTPHPPSQVQ